LEKSLARISPSLPTNLRDQLLFTAGQSSAQITSRNASFKQLIATAAASCLLTFSVSWIALTEQQHDPDVSSEKIANTAPILPTATPEKNLSSQSIETLAGHRTLSTRSLHFDKNRDNSSSFEFVVPTSHSRTLTPRSSLDL
jgi:hypothetical protein